MVAPMAKPTPTVLLNRWLSLRKLTQADFARRANINRGYLSSLCSGTRAAGLDVAMRIEAATKAGGRSAVPAESWLAFKPRKIKAA